ncbi:putative phase-variable hemagglutinin [Mycoplasmopsis synoviae 53]|uniref:Putative phase-variable hemagglutinin n=1 Tax=Mycoplasmopsis synoviae (strain 53) TaxID=262723 RepID=Q4A6D7_MYCS5|nr:putative phase-variable hemagglutinin [Mycoplasmopsis synoviae 53]
MVCGVDTWVWLPSVASSAGGVTTGAVNTLNGLTNLVKGILIKKVFNQLLLAIAVTAKYTASLSPFICCKNTLSLSKSSKVPGLSSFVFWTLVIVTPFIEFVTNWTLNLGSNLLT